MVAYVCFLFAFCFCFALLCEHDEDFEFRINPGKRVQSPGERMKLGGVWTFASDCTAWNVYCTVQVLCNALTQKQPSLLSSTRTVHTD